MLTVSRFPSPSLLSPSLGALWLPLPVWDYVKVRWLIMWFVSVCPRGFLFLRFSVHCGLNSIFLRSGRSELENP